MDMRQVQLSRNERCGREGGPGPGRAQVGVCIPAGLSSRRGFSLNMSGFSIFQLAAPATVCLRQDPAPVAAMVVSADPIWLGELLSSIRETARLAVCCVSMHLQLSLPGLEASLHNYPSSLHSLHQSGSSVNRPMRPP